MLLEKVLVHKGIRCWLIMDKMLWQIHSQKIEINNNDDAWIERKLREAQYNLDNYRIEGTVGKLNYLKK